MTTVSDPLAGLSGYGLKTPETKSANEMGEEQFMELMLAQMNHQDPFSPMENGEFLAQIAQFSTVNGIQDLQSSFDQFASSIQSSQALQASTLVGRSVLVPSETGVLPVDGPLQGEVDLPASTGNLVVQVQDASGQVVQNIPLGAQPAGRVAFQWDGTDESGQIMPPGQYYLTANAYVDGETQAVPTLTSARVDSVTLGQNGGEPILNLSGMGSMKFSSVREIS